MFDQECYGCWQHRATLGKYGKSDGEQLFTTKELTVEPGVNSTIKDTGAYGLICVQGKGTIHGQPLVSPKLIRFAPVIYAELAPIFDS